MPGALVVAPARALMRTPSRLLLDEPLGALDALTRIEKHGLIERMWLRYGFTALLVTHDVTEAVALADRVALPRPRARAACAARSRRRMALGYLSLARLPHMHR